MSYRKKKSSKHIELPLVGSDLSEVKNDRLITLVFVDDQGITAELVLEQAVTIFQSDAPPIQVLSTKPGITFNPLAIEPIMNLIGKKVKQAKAQQSGSLEVEFYDGVKFEIVPEIYEAWHFQKPAPGTIIPYPANHFSIHGSDGELL